MGEVYATRITKLDGSFALRQKDGIWKPDKRSRSSLDQLGYQFQETIGEGGASKIKKAHSKILNQTVAIKIIQKRKLPPKILDKFLPREIAILQKLQHPGLLDIYEVYETPNSIYIVEEYMPNGDLLDYINGVGSLTEADARRIFRQLLDIVQFLHKNDVYHRDIKCENILLDKFYNIRLTDFGFARCCPERKKLQTNCGSYVYAAPEVLNGQKYNGKKADIWGIGVCLYAMLCGKLPFRDEDIDILRYSVLEKLKFYRYISRDCRSLLRLMLNPEPALRPKIKSIFRNDWMCKPIKSGPGQSSMSQMSIQAVTSVARTPENYDPYAEHGFTCEQHSGKQKSTKVSDVLQCVAVNHSSGQSKIDLTKVAMPTKKVSSVAMVTGVSGPVGRRISVQLGIDTDNAALSQTQLQPNAGGGKLISAFGKSAGAGDKPGFKALHKFKCAVRTVAAVRRFRRGPLNTILNMPQDKAMARIQHTHEGVKDTELKELHHCPASKLANAKGQERRAVAEAKQRSLQVIQEAEELRNERFQQLDDTLAHITIEYSDDDEFSTSDIST